MLNTSCIWCLPLGHLSLAVTYQKEGSATDLPDSITGLLTPAYDCFWQVITPLFLITDSWPRGLILYKPLDSSWRGPSSWGMSLLCAPLCWLRIKAAFPFPPNSLSELFNRLWWTKKAKALASNAICSSQGYELVLSLEIPFQLLPMYTFEHAQNPLLLSTARQ